MFKIWMVNFGYFKMEEYHNLEDAKTAAKKTGFETSIYKENELVGSFIGVTLSWSSNT